MANIFAEMRPGERYARNFRLGPTSRFRNTGGYRNSTENAPAVCNQLHIFTRHSGVENDVKITKKLLRFSNVKCLQVLNRLRIRTY